MRFLILAILLLFQVSLFSQRELSEEKPPREDLAAAELIFEGKRYLQAREYPWAALKFKQALLRPEHQATSAALYLLGISYFFMEDRFEAHMQFDSLIHNFPGSRYVADAKYHKALMFLEEDQYFMKIRAMNLLHWVADSAQEKTLRDDAKYKARSFAFSSDVYFLERYLEAYESVNKLLFLEALCYRHIRSGDRELAQEIYQNWKNNGGEASAYLARQFDRRRLARKKDRNQFKIAIFLPLHLMEEDSIPVATEIPGKSKLGLEFYEGFKLAIDGREDLSREYIFKVFDTRKDSQQVEDLLYELDEFYPDLVLGSIFNTQSNIVSRWSEQTGTPQIIPLSPSASLIEDKQFTFLATPDISIHGKVMAEYAWDSLRLEKVAVWTNQTPNTDIMAQAFRERFQRLGGIVYEISIDPDYEKAKDEIPDLVRSLKFQIPDGVYIPIVNDEESAGLILSKIRALEIPIKVMGGPHWWKRYATVDESLKQATGLTFTSSFFTQKEDPKYQFFYETYLKKYFFPPSEYNVQGYDMGQYLLHVLDNYYPPSMSLENYIRNHPPYRGLHAQYDFREGQSNSYLNIGVYKEGKVVKLNDRKIWQIGELGDR